MTNRDLMYAMAGLDAELVLSAAPVEHPKKKRGWWISVSAAACFMLIVGAVILMLPKAPEYTTYLCGIPRDYRVGWQGGSTTEVTRVWTWDEMTTVERFNHVTFQERNYSVAYKIKPSLLGEKLGTCMGCGHKDATAQFMEFDVYRIGTISEELLVAVEIEGEFYAFCRREGGMVPREIAPATLGDYLDMYELSSQFGDFYSYYWDKKGERESLIFEDDQTVWRILNVCRDAKYDENAKWRRDLSSERGGTLYLNVPIDAEGIACLGFYISADGYITAGGYLGNYEFYIGEKVAGEIISYVLEHTKKTPYENYYKSFSGTLIEVTENYILVDDTYFCKKEKDGMVFKILTDDDFRYEMKRRRIEVGDIISVSFVGTIDTDDENIVSGAYSVEDWEMTVVE